MSLNSFKILHKSTRRRHLFIQIVCLVAFAFLTIYFIFFHSPRYAIGITTSRDRFSSFPFVHTTSTHTVPESVPAPNLCTAKRNIFFLKTHKCASSTVQNVLMRYGTRHDLNFVLPTLGNYLGNQAPFHRAMTSMAPWHRIGYNIFCHHTVFNEPEVTAIMPADTVFVTIVRDPVTLFESLYSYAHLKLHYKQDVIEFARNRTPNMDTFMDRSEGYLGLNQMAYDLGIRPNDMANRSRVEEAVRQLERRFGLVLVAEHFDESMILLKDLLCWNLEDVAYFRHNARRRETKLHLPEDVIEQLRVLQPADTYIYNHFLKLFRQRVEEFGVLRMEQEVAILRKLNSDLWTFCVAEDDDVGATSRGIFKTFSNQVETLVVKSVRVRNGTCQSMAKSEIAFTSQLKMSQTIKALRLMGGRPESFGKEGIGGAQAWFHRLSEEVGFVPINWSKIT